MSTKVSRATIGRIPLYLRYLKNADPTLENISATALAKALESGRLGGAGLDVQEQEPVPMDNPLLHLSPEAARRLVMAPHLGGVTGSVFRCQVEMAWGNLRRAERGEKPINIVKR